MGTLHKGGYESIMVGAMMGFFALAVILVMILHVATIPQLDFTRAFSGLRDFLKNSRNLAGVFVILAGLAAFAIYYLRITRTPVE